MPQNRAGLPVPTVEAEALLALSHATSSSSVLAGRVLRAVIQYGTLGSSATGTRSVSRS